MKKVLVIEDDTDTADIMKLILKGIDFDVTVSNTKLPLAELVVLDPCLIILDHLNASFLGGEYCKEIKAFPATEKIPVLMISATFNLDKIATEACADDYIEKPFDINLLEEKVIKLTTKLTA